MTVALTSSVERYAYSGPGDYSFNFPFPLTSDVYVSYIDTAGASSALELNTDYTVAANSDSDGGVVTITSPTSPGGVITIERTLSFTQNTVFENEGPLQMSLIEGAFDRSVMLLQQMNELISGLKVSISWRYTWTTDTEYVTKDVVVAPGGNDWYQCIVDNTSGDTFTTDVASGYWVKVLDFTAITNSVASALEGVYPVPTAADEGKVPVVQSDASMAYEDIPADIVDLQTEMDLKAALSLFTNSGFNKIHATGYAYVNGLLIQVVSGVMINLQSLTLTFPIAYTAGYTALYSQVDGNTENGSTMRNTTLSKVEIYRPTVGEVVRFNVIAIGV